MAGSDTPRQHDIPVDASATGDQPAGAADEPAANSVSGDEGVGSAGPDRAGDPTAQDARTPAVTVRGTAATATRDVRLKIRRFLPEQDAEPHWETYTVPTEQGDRLLDAIHWVKWNLDGSLTFRRSCAHGVCGSDAMRVNGVNRLACKVLTKDLGDEVLLEPIKGLPVLKDLVVDMEPFFEAYRSVRPFLIPGPHEPTKERLQSAKDRDRFDDTTKCILCAACTTSCPVYWSDDAYFGPAAIVNAHRFIFDSRDEGGEERLEILNTKEGVWRCRTTFNCTDACPRGIEVTKAIQEVKRALIFRRF